MKIHILFEFQAGSSGGGNQFLKALKNYFVKQQCYVESCKEADIILFNSYQYIPDLIQVKRAFPNKLFIHRIDGPIRLYNHIKDQRDFVTNYANKFIADGTIFQSDWSRIQNLKMGLSSNKYETTILNAPNSSIFNPKLHKKFDPNSKVKIIATSWSANWKKGFVVYQWLDNHIDFNQFQMTFIGNSPIQFNNIIHKNPMSSEDLAKELLDHDIFITASQKDPCSNSLIEALHCGLPAIVLKDGGHPEITQNGGETFNNPDEILSLLIKIKTSYEKYQNNIKLPTMNEVGADYYLFMKQIYADHITNNYKSKQFCIFNQMRLQQILLFWKLWDKYSRIKQKVLSWKI